MPTVEEHKLSPEEFHARYSGEKPYFEYWNGEAVQKTSPTRLHSLIQEILVRLLDTMGYDAGISKSIRLTSRYRM